MKRSLFEDTPAQAWKSLTNLTGFDYKPGVYFNVGQGPLALALSGLEGRQSFVDTLFIDEGFGSLDAESLDTAIDALESLQSHGRTVGVISHVDAMKDRIPVQVKVVRQGLGRSIVTISAPEGWAA